MTERMDAMSLDQFWREYEEGCAELAGVQTVDRVIKICKRRWGSSAGDAFFPGGSGDVELLSILTEAGWSPVWVEAYYFFAIRAPHDVCQICHEPIEVDAERGYGYRHSHADKDVYCGTGDGSTAYPSGDDGLTYIEGDIQRGIQPRPPRA